MSCSSKAHEAMTGRVWFAAGREAKELRQRKTKAESCIQTAMHLHLLDVQQPEFCSFDLLSPAIAGLLKAYLKTPPRLTPGGVMASTKCILHDTSSP